MNSVVHDVHCYTCRCSYNSESVAWITQYRWHCPQCKTDRTAYPPGTFTVCYGRVGTFVMRRLTALEQTEEMPSDVEEATLTKVARKPKGAKLHVKGAKQRARHAKQVRYPGGQHRQKGDEDASA